MEPSGKRPIAEDDFQTDSRSFEFVNNDANAWLVVPTFNGEPPRICGIDGFSEPIVDPNSWHEWAPHIASMLKDARTIVQRTLHSPEEFRRLNHEFWQHIMTDDGLIIESGFSVISIAHRDAFLYSSFIRALREALWEVRRGSKKGDPTRGFSRLAYAAALLSEWASGNTDRMVRERARSAGQRSGEERRKGGKREAIEKAIRSLEATVSDQDIPGILKRRGIATDRYVRKVLRKIRETEKRN